MLIIFLKISFYQVECILLQSSGYLHVGATYFNNSVFIFIIKWMLEQFFYFFYSKSNCFHNVGDNAYHLFEKRRISIKGNLKKTIKTVFFATWWTDRKVRKKLTRQNNQTTFCSRRVHVEFLDLRRFYSTLFSVM